MQPNPLLAHGLSQEVHEIVNSLRLIDPMSAVFIFMAYDVFKAELPQRVPYAHHALNRYDRIVSAVLKENGYRSEL